ncbi:MAG: IS1595 family transposase, partial [Bacteroidales bacterium]|nr:IS1595 family transposase [Bacteroidales bacterium]
MSKFATIYDLIKKFPDEQTCINHLEALRWGGKVISPFDPDSQVYKCKGNRYRCRNTQKYFNVKTGTIFEDTKIPLQKWFMALYIFSSHKKGISSHQLAKDIGVTQKTAWFLLHRLRYAFNHPSFKNILENHVEADETYIGGDEKNK